MGEGQSVILCPKALPPPVSLRSEDSARAHRNLGLEYRKTLPPRSLPESPGKPGPSAVPFGATCWSTVAYFPFLPPSPGGQPGTGEKAMMTRYPAGLSIQISHHTNCEAPVSLLQSE